MSNRFFAGVRYLLNEKNGTVWAWTEALSKKKGMTPYYPNPAAVEPASKMSRPIQGIAEQAETEASLTDELTKVLTKLQKFSDGETGRIDLLAQMLVQKQDKREQLTEAIKQNAINNPAPEPVVAGVAPRGYPADIGGPAKEAVKEALGIEPAVTPPVTPGVIGIGQPPADGLAVAAAMAGAQAGTIPVVPVTPGAPAPGGLQPPTIPGTVEPLPPITPAVPPQTDGEFMAEFGYLSPADFRVFVMDNREKIVQSNNVVRSAVAQTWAEKIKPERDEDKFPYELAL